MYLSLRQLTLLYHVRARARGKAMHAAGMEYALSRASSDCPGARLVMAMIGAMEAAQWTIAVLYG